MKTFPLRIGTPDGLLFEGEAERIICRAVTGDLAILAGHIPFVTALKDGECRLYTGENGETIRRARCRGGMLIVSKEAVRVMSSDFEWEN